MTDATARAFGPAVLASCSALDLTLTTASQYETARLGGRPVATVSRGRVYSSEPAWSAHDTQAQLICTADTALEMVRALRLHFLAHNVTTCATTGLVSHVRPLHLNGAGDHFANAAMFAIEAAGLRTGEGEGARLYALALRVRRSILSGDLFAADLEIGERTVSFKAGR